MPASCRSDGENSGQIVLPLSQTTAFINVHRLFLNNSLFVTNFLISNKRNILVNPLLYFTTAFINICK